MNIAQIIHFAKIIKAYLMNIKTMIGLLLLCYALYMCSTDVPLKWSALSTAKAANTKLVEDKKNLSFQEAKLKAIAKELDKVKVKIYQLDKDVATNLAMIDVAQKVIDLV